MMRGCKKSFFTLLELLIVLFLISLGMTLTGVKIKEVYQEQRFLSESQQVLSYLMMAQDLMLIMDTDVKVKFTQDPETRHPTVSLKVEKPLEPAWAKLIERKLHLQAIQSYQFEGNSGKDLVLQFSLGRMSKGSLILSEAEQGVSPHSDKRQFQINLVGYPSPLGAPKASEKEDNQANQSQQLYPIEVYEKLYSNSK